MSEAADPAVPDDDFSLEQLPDPQCDRCGFRFNAEEPPECPALEGTRCWA